MGKLLSGLTGILMLMPVCSFAGEELNITLEAYAHHNNEIGPAQKDIKVYPLPKGLFETGPSYVKSLPKRKIEFEIVWGVLTPRELIILSSPWHGVNTMNRWTL